jgi:pyrroloquinoline quinone (PQQ) biosynthesis protein C
LRFAASASVQVRAAIDSDKQKETSRHSVNHKSKHCLSFLKIVGYIPNRWPHLTSLARKISRPFCHCMGHDMLIYKQRFFRCILPQVKANILDDLAYG